MGGFNTMEIPDHTLDESSRKSVGDIPVNAAILEEKLDQLTK